MGVLSSRKTEFARTLRREMTFAEKKLWAHLRLRNLDGYKFRRQFVIGKFIVDFACLRSALVIEIDGGQHAESVPHDEMRTAAINAAGFRVLRFWNNEVTENMDGVAAVILAALHENDLPPS